MYVVIKGKKLIGAALCLIIVAAAVISWIGFSNRDDGAVELRHPTIIGACPSRRRGKPRSATLRQSF